MASTTKDAIDENDCVLLDEALDMDVHDCDKERDSDCRDAVSSELTGLDCKSMENENDDLSPREDNEANKTGAKEITLNDLLEKGTSTFNEELMKSSIEVNESLEAITKPQNDSEGALRKFGILLSRLEEELQDFRKQFATKQKEYILMCKVLKLKELAILKMRDNQAVMNYIVQNKLQDTGLDTILKQLQNEMKSWNKIKNKAAANNMQASNVNDEFPAIELKASRALKQLNANRNSQGHLGENPPDEAVQNGVSNLRNAGNTPIEGNNSSNVPMKKRPRAKKQINVNAVPGWKSSDSGSDCEKSQKNSKISLSPSLSYNDYLLSLTNNAKSSNSAGNSGESVCKGHVPKPSSQGVRATKQETTSKSGSSSRSLLNSKQAASSKQHMNGIASEGNDGTRVNNHFSGNAAKKIKLAKGNRSSGFTVKSISSKGFGTNDDEDMVPLGSFSKQEDTQESAPLCQGCHSKKALFICAGCGSQWYCSRDCQVASWDEHSELCSS